MEKDEQGKVVVFATRRAQDAVEQLDALGCAGDRRGHGAAAHGGAHGKQCRFETAPVEGDIDGMVLDIEAGDVIAGEFGHGCSFGVIRYIHHSQSTAGHRPRCASVSNWGTRPSRHV